MAKILVGVALTSSSLYGLPIKKAIAWEMVLPSGAIMVVPDDNSTSKTQQSNSNLHKEKQQKEFQPPELLYCKINYAGMKGIEITYWTKKGRKYELSWIVENITEGIGGATVSLQASYTHGNYGLYEIPKNKYGEIVSCVSRAVLRMLKSGYYSGGADKDLLYLKAIRGDLKDFAVLKFVEY